MVHIPIKRSPQLLLLVCALALAGVVAVRAADDKAKDREREGDRDRKTRNDRSDRTDRRDDEILKKYDKNANGKLDPDEDAAMKADQAKAERKKKG